MASSGSFFQSGARRSPGAAPVGKHSCRLPGLWFLLAAFLCLVGSACAESHASEAAPSGPTEADTDAVGPMLTHGVAQPIAYSHKTHIEAGLECKRCHAGAFENKRAGLPPLATCISCHRRTIPDHPEVKKLLDAWATETPLQWVKVNVLPDKAMVQFHHAAHARAEVGCEQCHGDVASMTIAEPVVDVARMGWCVECHRDNGASDDCLACHY